MSSLNYFILKKILPYIILVLLLGGVYGYLQYNKGHKMAKDVNADVVISPQELLSAFEKDEMAANKLYLDKVLEVEGIIKSINNSDTGASIHLDTGNSMSDIICEMEPNLQTDKLQAGQKIKIKGFCTGKLMDVVLVRCTL